MPERARRSRRSVTRTHEWLDADGVLLFEHRKFDDGSWSYRHPVRKSCREHGDDRVRGGWCYTKPASAASAMWNAADLSEAIAGRLRVGWFAGEKDATAADGAGLADACTSVHQGEATETYPEQLEWFSGFRGRLDLYGDDDATGRANLLGRYVAVEALGVSGKRVRLFLPAEGANDVSDHLSDADARARGFRELTLIELKRLVAADAKATREKKRAAEGGKAGGKVKLAAFEEALAACGCKRGTGQDWTCPHPEHRDRHPSFGVTIGETGGLILNCQKCMPRSGTPEHAEWLDEVLGALGLDLSAISAKRRKSSSEGRGRDAESVSDKVLKIAFENYTLGMNDEGKPFAYPNGGHIVSFFDKGNGQLAADLAADYHKEHGKSPGAAALNDAILTLTGYARNKEPQEIAIRTGMVAGGEDISKSIVLDMGDSDESVIRVGPEGWAIEDRSPVLFRRTKATMPYPRPVPGGDIGLLRGLLNVSDADFGLIVAWLVASLVPEIQHPIMMLNGEHGTGKSDATRMLTLLVDPSVAPLRRRPREEREWSVAAMASWVISLENMSWIEPWLSDDLCTAVTGVGDIERQYHTNDDIRVRKIKRAIIINGIDPGGIRGDLADRMFAIRLHRITERLSELELSAKFEALRPVLLGALLDLLVEVRRVQLSGENWIETNERMHDFALLCRAVDLVRGTKSYERFIVLRRGGLTAVTEDDPMTAAIVAFLAANKGAWVGSGSALLELLEAYRGTAVRGWPGSATALGQSITRLMPGWREMGITAKRGYQGSKRVFSLSMKL